MPDRLPVSDQNTQEKFFRDEELSPLPAEALPALAMKDFRKQSIFIKIPAQARPELYEKVSGNRYTPLNWKSIRLIQAPPPKALTCWNIVISGGTFCPSDIHALSKIDPPHLKKFKGELDLLEYSRWAKEKYGMRVARDFVHYRMGNLDASKTNEARVLKTTKNPQFTYPDSMVNLPVSLKKTNWFFCHLRTRRECRQECE